MLNCVQSYASKFENIILYWNRLKRWKKHSYSQIPKDNMCSWIFFLIPVLFSAGISWWPFLITFFFLFSKTNEESQQRKRKKSKLKLCYTYYYYLAQVKIENEIYYVCRPSRQHYKTTINAFAVKWGVHFVAHISV